MVIILVFGCGRTHFIRLIDIKFGFVTHTIKIFTRYTLGTTKLRQLQGKKVTPMNSRFFICSICGQLINVIEDKDLPFTCCMTEMTELIPHTSEEENGEHHLPVYSRRGNVITVRVGKLAHPMSPQHHIKWILLHTKNGCQRVELSDSDEPVVEFHVAPDDEILSVYCYCNIHGLWKTE